MAMTTNIPPQAYTRDTLVKAIEWMSQQSPAVRERANSADLIVSYYLQARRRMSAAQMEAPVSGEAFKQDLKHLAQDLKQFEEPSAPPPQTPSRSLSHGNDSRFRVEPPPGTFELPEVPLHTHNHLHTAPAPQQHSQQHVHLHVQHAPQPPPQPLPPPPVVHHVPPRPEAPKGVQWTVDPKSLTFARELMERFNLSNEGEAIRMLITLGIERAREIFP